jgi:putative flippase GtrA
VRGDQMRFVRYLLAGGLAAVANYLSRFAFSIWFSFEVSVVMACIVGLATGFLLMRNYVFDGVNKPLRPQVARYLGVNLIALLLTVAISSYLARSLLPRLGITAHVEAIAHAVGISAPLLSSYVGHRWLTFR